MSDALFPMTMQNALTRRGGAVLVGPVHLSLDRPEAVVVIGPNGSGKTSLLRLMHGAARLHDGRIDWACPTQQARRQQSFVFQTPVMLRRSVVDNIAYPLRLRGIGRTAARAQAAVWAGKVGLEGMLERPAALLSGGERQKLALARGLITDPALVFLDEPTASLDGHATAEIESILTEAHQQGTALVMSTHNMGQARRVADRVLFMLRGQVVEDAPAASFFDHPQSASARAFLKGDIV